MNSETAQTLSVAGRIRTLEDAMGVIERYPRKTPTAFDYIGTGDPFKLTEQEVIRTRKISSRISNQEVSFFVETAATAPWISPGADLANADPDIDGHGNLFGAMTDLYWHFAEKAPKGVSFAKISKVLHLKLPGLYPILDSHIKHSYKPAAQVLEKTYPQLGWRRRTWIAVRNDLLSARSSGALDELRGSLQTYKSDDIHKQQGVRQMNTLTDLRLLDILVW